jgi:hypothetical protein
MGNDEFVVQIKKLLEAEREQTKTIIREEVEASEKRVIQKIDDSQKDTIEVLSALIHEGHRDHENQISQLEQDHEFPHSHWEAYRSLASLCNSPFAVLHSLEPVHPFKPFDQFAE